MTIYLEGMMNPIELSRPFVYVNAIAIMLGICALFVLRAIGLSTLAKRNGVKRGVWTVWVPFLWIYVACRIVSDMRIFGMSFKTLAIVGLCIFSVYGVAYIIYNVIYYAPLVLYYLQGGEIMISSTAPVGEFVSYFDVGNGILVSVKLNLLSYKEVPMTDGTTALVPYFFPYANRYLFTRVNNVCVNIVNYIYLFKVLGTCFVYSAIFRKYWVEHFMLGTLLSIFIEPMFSIFIFIIRKNPPARLVRVVRIDPDFNNFNANNENNAEDPFKEFNKEKPKKNQDPGDPFADFWDKKD